MFSEFAQRLYSVIGSGSNTSAFARTLLDTIVEYEDDELNPIQELKSPTFKAYYNGTNNITKTAKKINANVETSAFEEYIKTFPDNAGQALCSVFEDDIPDITLHNVDQKLAELFASIIYEAAAAKPQTVGKSKSSEKQSVSAHEALKEKVLASGEAAAKAWSAAVKGVAEEISNEQQKGLPIKVEELNKEDMSLLRQFRSDVKPILKYCIEHDPTAEATKIDLADEIHDTNRKWQFELREIEDVLFRQLVIDTIKTLDEYSYYLSDVFLRLLPGGEALWFRNESAEEGDRLRNVFHPEAKRLRYEIRDLYLRLYPIPEDAKQEETESIEAEVVDEESSGAADAEAKDVKTQIINNPTIVNQYGEKNVHIDHVENLKL